MDSVPHDHAVKAMADPAQRHAAAAALFDRKDMFAQRGALLLEKHQPGDNGVVEASPQPDGRKLSEENPRHLRLHF